MRFLDDATAPGFLSWASRAPHIALDIETTTLGRGDADARIRYAQVGDATGEVWFVRERHKYLLLTALARASVVLAHNGLYDAAWLESSWGLPMGPVVARMTDTFLMASLYDPRRSGAEPGDRDEDDTAEPAPGRGLKDLAVRHLGPGADEARQALHTAHGLHGLTGRAFTARWRAIPDEDPLLLAYAADDVVLTSRLYLWFLEHLTAEEVGLLDVEREIAAAAYRVTVRGLHVDVEAAERTRDRLLGERARLDVLLGRHGLDNANSPAQVVDALLRSGLVLEKRTDTGALSADRSVLQALHAATGHPLPRLVEEARVARRYARNYAGALADSGGIVHPTVNPFGAVTGRWTVSGPPLQQWPKTGRYPVPMRPMLVAPPGQVLVSADLSSIEPVVAAAITGDRNLISAVSGEKVTVYEDLMAGAGIASRQLAKVTFLSGMYGTGAAKLSPMIGRPVDEAKALRAATFGGWRCEEAGCPSPVAFDCEDHRTKDEGYYPGPRLYREALRKALENGVEGWPGETRDGWPGLRNAYGRWVPIPQAGGGGFDHNGTPSPFNHFNHHVQGLARDLLMRMVVDLRRAGLEVWLTVHDEIVLAVDPADADDARRFLLETMTSPAHPVLGGLPVRAEAAPVSPVWNPPEGKS